MARLIQGLAGPNPAPRSADTLTDLTRLLNRLQQTVLKADAEREKRLRMSEYERRKVTTNISYARNLLAKVEQDSRTIKVLDRRTELQLDLTRKRQLLEQLVERVHDLEEMAAAVLADDEDSSEGEDILGKLIATPSESLDSASSNIPAEQSEDRDAWDEEKTSLPVAESSAVPTAQEKDEVPHFAPAPAEESISEKRGSGTETTQALRSRSQKEPRTSEKDKAVSTSTSLFGERTNTSAAPVATTEAILDHQKAEQDFLLESLSKMAAELNASSHAFAISLDEEKVIMNKAAEGLEKNEQGLDAAARRMGALQQGKRGNSLMGRILGPYVYLWEYAKVYGLMLFLVLLVLFGPKIRW